MNPDKPESRDDTRDNRVKRVSDPDTTREAGVRPGAGIPPPSRVLTDVVTPHRDQPVPTKGLDSLPDREAPHWREHHAARRDLPGAPPYEACAPAYRFGARERQRYGPGAAWDDAESVLAHDWKAARGECTLSWAEAMPAVRAAWEGRAAA